MVRPRIDRAFLYVQVQCPNCPEVVLKTNLDNTLECFKCNGLWRIPSIDLERIGDAEEKTSNRSA